jgi:predicted nucleic acid-binding protein
VANVFFDTNIWGYTIDKHDPLKQAKAISLVDEAMKNDVPVISTQVLQELYSIGTTKLKMEPIAVKALVHNLRRLTVVQLTPDLIETGIDISVIAKISFWDSLIIAAAEAAYCTTLYTEDLNNGQIIRGVKVVHPF